MNTLKISKKKLWGISPKSEHYFDKTPVRIKIVKKNVVMSAKSRQADESQFGQDGFL